MWRDLPIFISSCMLIYEKLLGDHFDEGLERNRRDVDNFRENQNYTHLVLGEHLGSRVENSDRPARFAESKSR